MDCLPHIQQGTGPQPRHVPWPGIEPTTFQFAGWCSIDQATPTRADLFFFYNWQFVPSEPLTHFTHPQSQPLAITNLIFLKIPHVHKRYFFNKCCMFGRFFFLRLVFMVAVKLWECLIRTCLKLLQQQLFSKLNLRGVSDSMGFGQFRAPPNPPAEPLLSHSIWAAVRPPPQAAVSLLPFSSIAPFSKVLCIATILMYVCILHRNYFYVCVPPCTVNSSKGRGPIF